MYTALQATEADSIRVEVERDRWSCDNPAVVERATLKLDSGDEIRVEVERDDLKRDEIVVRRKGRSYRAATRDARQVISELLADSMTKRRPAGTTDRLLAADRSRPY